MKLKAPSKEYIPAPPESNCACNECPYMKLNTLEKLVAEKGVTTQDTLHRYKDAWDHACDRTPHGQPIELKAEDFR